MTTKHKATTYRLGEQLDAAIASEAAKLGLSRNMFIRMTLRQVLKLTEVDEKKAASQ